MSIVTHGNDHTCYDIHSNYSPFACIFLFCVVFFCFFLVFVFIFFFFFSSRRRHTRLTCDWSSDVCSSDLIARILTANHTPRARIVGIFAEVEELLAGSEFRGCRFISAAAEARPGDASEVVAAEYRAWLLSLLTDLAKAAGASDAKQLGRRLLLLYDGAAVAARMDRDRDAAAGAIRSAVVALLEAALPAERSRRRAR